LFFMNQREELFVIKFSRLTLGIFNELRKPVAAGINVTNMKK